MGVLGISLGIAPDLPCPSCLELVHALEVEVLVVVVAGKVAVVVGTGVLGVVPVEGGGAVLAEAIKHGGRCLELVGRSIVVLEIGDGLVGAGFTGVTHHSVLVAPVRVVHIVAHQVVNFLGGGVLLAAAARGAHEHEAELVGVVELLLHGSVVCERTVVNALDPVVAAQTGAHVECI